MTPFLLKHTKTFMLENEDMQGVASLQKDKKKIEEVNNAAEMGRSIAAAVIPKPPVPGR